MLRRLLTVLSVLTVGFVLAVRADDRLPNFKGGKASSGGGTAVEGDKKLIQEDAAAKQERLKRQFDDFKQALLQLAQRLDKSPREEDRTKAEVLRTAIKKASDEGVDTKFTVLVDGLKKAEMIQSTTELKTWLDQNTELRHNLRDIIELLLKDDRDAQLRAEREKTMRLIEELKGILKKQELHRTKVQMGRGETQDLARQQQKITEQTARIGQPKSNKGSEAKQGEGKDGGKKGREGVGEAKNDSKDPKADPKKGENKDGKEGKGGEGKDSKEGKDAKAGEGKDGKGGEGKDGKPSEGKSGKEGEGKEGKGGEGKDGKPGEGKDGKPGEGKDGKPGEGKQGKPGEGKDGKPGEGKQGKPGEGKQGKPGEGKGKPGDGKPSAGKPGAGKPGEGKQGKPGEGKAGDSKGKGEGKGEAKGGKAGEGKPGEGKGGKSGQSGQPGQPGQPGQQGEGKDSGQKGGQQPPQPPQDITQIKKQIQDAKKYQEGAENDLKKEDRPNAGKNEESAEEKLKEAMKKLEDLLRQIREEEIERLLARLEQRCRHMLAMQIQVRDGTVELDRVIQGNPDKKKTRADDQQATGLADKENEIIHEASDALRLLESEGSDVAFSEVFKQVRSDMETVEAHLRKADVGVVTVTIENDIIDTLKEMLEALKKAQKKPGKPSKGGGGGGGQPQDQKLIDMLSELKMIRSMQKRVNDRTTVYGKQYNGEQAPPPDAAGDAREREVYERIQQELKDLAGRQKKISRITRDIAEGKTEDK